MPYSGDQPLGFSEPRYDEIDGLSWAWCGGSDHVEGVVGGMSPHHSLFSGWANNYVAGEGTACLTFTPERPVPFTTANDFTMEYIGEFISRQVGGTPSSFLFVGNGTFPVAGNGIGFGIGGSTGSIQAQGPSSGFQAIASGLSPSTGWAHYIVSRYRGRYFHWLKRYATGIITRNLDQAPTSNPTTWTGSPTIYLLKSSNDTDAMSGRIAKAAIYTRGMPEAEAEDLLQNPWQTFRAPRRRLYLLQGGGGVTGVANITLGAVTLSAAGGVQVAGAASLLGSATTATSAGAILVAGAATLVGSSVSAAGAGALLVQGSASITLDAVSISAAGVVGSTPIIGAADITLGATGVAADGAAAVAGAASITLGTVSLAAAGTVGGGAITGDADITLGAVTVSAQGAVLVSGAASITLGEVSTSLGPISGGSTINLAECALQADGVLLIAGTASIRLGSMQASGGPYVPLGAAQYTTRPDDLRRIGASRPSARSVIQ